MDARTHAARTHRLAHACTRTLTQLNTQKSRIRAIYNSREASAHRLNGSQLNWVLTIPVKPVLTEWVPTELGAHNSCEASAHWMGPNWTGCSQFLWSQCSLNGSQLNWVLTIPVKPVLTEWVPTELGAHTRSVTAALVPLTTNSSAALLCAHAGPRPGYCVLTLVRGLTTVCSQQL